VKLGQQYVAHLIDQPYVGGNLFLIMAAYNGGPGNLIKWLRALEGEGDPLLFIETIPNRETRGFVERVMANYWIYRHAWARTWPASTTSPAATGRATCRRTPS